MPVPNHRDIPNVCAFINLHGFIPSSEATNLTQRKLTEQLGRTGNARVGRTLLPDAFDFGFDFAARCCPPPDLYRLQESSDNQTPIASKNRVADEWVG
jgi:hypothetical protein